MHAIVRRSRFPHHHLIAAVLIVALCAVSLLRFALWCLPIFSQIHRVSQISWFSSFCDLFSRKNHPNPPLLVCSRLYNLSLIKLTFFFPFHFYSLSYFTALFVWCVYFFFFRSFSLSFFLVVFFFFLFSFTLSLLRLKHRREPIFCLNHNFFDLKLVNEMQKNEINEQKSIKIQNIN